MIVIRTQAKIGRVPEWKGKQYGKIQIASVKLAHLIGMKVEVLILVPENKGESLEIQGDLHSLGISQPYELATYKDVENQNEETNGL